MFAGRRDSWSVSNAALRVNDRMRRRRGHLKTPNVPELRLIYLPRVIALEVSLE